MRLGAGLLMGLAACWTGAAAEVPAPVAPPLRRTVRPPSPETVTASPAAPALLAKPPPRFDPELASRLRGGGEHVMLTFVAGPIVVLDLDTGSVSTLCGVQAIATVQAWGRAFANPTANRVGCRIGSEKTACVVESQAGGMIHVELADPGHPHIDSAFVTATPGRATNLVAKLDRQRDAIAVASCP